MYYAGFTPPHPALLDALRERKKLHEPAHIVLHSGRIVKEVFAPSYPGAIDPQYTSVFAVAGAYTDVACQMDVLAGRCPSDTV